MENLPGGPELPTPSLPDKSEKKSSKKSARSVSIPLPIEKADHDASSEKKPFASVFKDREKPDKSPDLPAAEKTTELPTEAEKSTASPDAEIEKIVRDDLSEHLAERQAFLPQDLADHDFVSRAKDNFEDTTKPMDEAVPKAFEDTTQKLEDSLDEPAESTDSSKSPESTGTPSADVIDDTDPPTTTPISSRSTPPPGPTSSKPTPPPAGTPPIPPLPPITPAAHHAAAPPPASPDTLSPPPARRPESRDDDRPRHSRRRVAGAFATGVLVGEVHGRHRVKKRANKEIKRQKELVADREAQIRHLAAEQLKRSVRTAPEVAIAASKAKEETPKPEAVPKKAPEEPIEHQQSTWLNKPETKPVTKAEEVGPPPEIEPIILPRVDTIVSTKVENESQDVPLEAAIPAPKYHFEQMPTPQLLEVAEKIRVGGENLRDLYNNDRLDRPALIKVLKEAYLGHDIKHALEVAELGRERQVERAREYRHDDPGFTSASDNTTPVATASPLIDNVLPATPQPETLEPIQSSFADSNNRGAAAPLQTLPPAVKSSRLPLITVSSMLAVGLGLVIAWLLLR